ncbi:MAG TPA: hypothetical protein VMT34_13940 [Aggregatilineales bacterium]|nr:hypothetical protein [Aggregatilineales bacterium]
MTVKSVIATVTARPAASIEVVTPGISVEWLYDRRIAAFTILDFSPLGVATWMGRLKTILTGWPAAQPCLCLADFSDPHAHFTPYMHVRAHELQCARPDLTFCMALIFPRNHLTRLFQISRRGTRNYAELSRFFNREDGLAWLVNKLADH